MNLSIRDLRAKVRSARADGRERLITLQADALDRAGDWLERTPDMPGIERLSTAAQRAVTHRLDQVTAVEVDGWDSLNARNAIQTVREVDDLSVLRALRRREAVTKDRKTVLSAVDARLDALVPATAAD